MSDRRRDRGVNSEAGIKLAIALAALAYLALVAMVIRSLWAVLMP